jgi:NAD(P) transhydrogenase subunit alpha
MKPGSVIVDLAAQQGGNCALTVQDASIVAHGIVIIGHTNLPALVAADATALYARNILSFLNLLLDPASGEIRIDRSDEIVSATLICTEGASVRRQEMSPA